MTEEQEECWGHYERNTDKCKACEVKPKCIATKIKKQSPEVWNAFQETIKELKDDKSFQDQIVKGVQAIGDIFDALDKLKKYDSQKYSCCQLIAAINAKIFLTGSGVSDEEFEKYVDLVKCRYGAAISVEKVYPYLGLDFIDGTLSLEWLSKSLPVEVSIFDDDFGFHSILVISVEGDTIEMLNPNKRVSFNTLKEISSEHRCRSFKKKRKNLKGVRV